MRFTFEKIEALPALAWCMYIGRNSCSAKVTHGPMVECQPDFFYEGCWIGDVSAEDALSAPVSSATGATIKGGTLMVFSPTNTLGRLHVIDLVDGLWISNSMTFVVAASKQAIRSHYHFYQEDLSSIIFGLDKAVSSVPLENGASLTLFYHCNISIDRSLKVICLPKNPCSAFGTFAEYRRFLGNSLASLLANARSKQRVFGFEPITSISRGYDSITCAVLAKESGCRDAVTFVDTESDEPDADNGADLAIALGLQVTVSPRTAYKLLQNEYEFLSCGTGGEDVFFSPLANQLKGRVFVSGFHGDKVWDKNLKKISTQIVRGDPSGADLEEFRLRVGFIHVAVPFFGCRAPAAIYRISIEPAMAPWSVNSDYDRPICRRIAEEAGLNREDFGRKKRVMSRSFEDVELNR